MTLPRTYRAVGLTLRKRIAGEADVITTLLTREHGKLDALARGARRLTSKLMGHFEPLTLLRVSIVRGRALDVISEAEVITAFQSVKTDYQTTARALYVVELVDGFSAEAVSNPQLFDLTLQTLKAVAEHPTSDLPLRHFDLQILHLSGFLPELYCCIECGADLEPERHRFSAGAGGTLCPDCTPPDTLVRPLSLSALKVLRLLHRTSQPNQLPDIQVPDAVQNEVNATLSASLQFWLDREVNSKTFLEATKLA